MEKFNIAKNIQYQTALLESLNWDEKELVKLMNYLDVEFNSFETKHPSVIINFVSEHFSTSTSLVLKSIFGEIAVYNNMHKGGYNEEH